MNGYDVLGVLAATLMDTQQLRIATENRLRSLPTDDSPIATYLAATVARLGVTEDSLTLELKREVRRTPLGPWVKGTVGVGEVVVGRFLGFAGDPALIVDRDTGEVTPRKLSQFRQYCGYGAPARRKRGEKANWSPGAKSWAYLMAECCLKQTGVRGRRSPFRDVYDESRLRYEGATHVEPCAQCGPSGSPALAGSPLSDGHKHMRAMRIVVKEILADMWRESVAAHGFVFADPWRDHARLDTHRPNVAPPRSGDHAGPSFDRGEIAA